MGNIQARRRNKASRAALRQELEEIRRQTEKYRTDLLEAQEAKTELATLERELNESKRREEALRQELEAREAEKQLKVQWRTFEKGGDWSPQYEGQLKQELKVYKTHAKLKSPNIFLIGHTGAGKSSFINSIATVDLDRIATPMIAGEASTSMSLRLKKYVANNNLQNFVVYETMGLETDTDAGFNVQDIVFLIRGHVKPNYRFNPASPIDPSDKSFVKHPSLKDKAHCVAFVVDSNAMASKSIEHSMELKIEELQYYLRELEIPTVVVLTKIDVTSNDVEEDVKMTYNSKEIKDAVEEACRVFKVPEMHILPVKNYTKETSPESCLNILTLLALRKILQLSSDYLTTTFALVSEDKKRPALKEENAKAVAREKNISRPTNSLHGDTSGTNRKTDKEFSEESMVTELSKTRENGKSLADLDQLTLTVDEKNEDELFEAIPKYKTLKKLNLQFENGKNMFSVPFVSSLALVLESLPDLESVTLLQMNIGKQQIDSIELTYKEIHEIKRLNENKGHRVNVCTGIFRRLIRKKELNKFDIHDFQRECEKGDSFEDSIILNLIAQELTATHKENVCTTIPSVFEGDTQPTLICIVKKQIEITEFRGFPVKTAPMEYLSKFSIKAENSIDRNSEEYKLVVSDNIADINEVISHHSERLLSEHSNIEAIRASFVKQGKSTMEPNRPCVVIYCRVKGAVPFKENLFPKRLHHPKKEKSYPTDIREGYFFFCLGATDWHQELAMGCSIGELNMGLAGTLGPFVNVVETKELCFLTARHIFPSYYSIPDDQILQTKVVQQADYHLLPQVPYDDPDRECGELVTCALTKEIDAALVRINEDRKPSRGLFVDIAQGDLLRAGLAANQIPAFDDGEMLDVSGLTISDNACQPILKVGVTSGLTKGYLSTTEGVVRETVNFETLESSYNNEREVLCLRGQITVDSLAKKDFCQAGDSGAGVFLLDSELRLKCIGIIVGMMSDKTAIVTPITKILNTLGCKYGQRTLELKNFSLENMEIDN